MLALRLGVENIIYKLVLVTCRNANPDGSGSIVAN